MSSAFLDWLTKYEAVAIWLEGIALVAIFGLDWWNGRKGHKETMEQLKVAQDQIKISQNAERAWVMTELEWPEGEKLRLVTGTSRQGDEPQVETTTVIVKLKCGNDGRSPAWVDKIQGYCEIVEGRLGDLPSPIGHKAESFPTIGPIGPGNHKWRILHLQAPGHIKNNQLLSIFVLVEYRDIFEQKRVTTCGYTVSGAHLDRQDQFPDRNRNT
jgi:hypothetical protein